MGNISKAENLRIDNVSAEQEPPKEVLELRERMVLAGIALASTSHISRRSKLSPEKDQERREILDEARTALRLR